MTSPTRHHSGLAYVDSYSFIFVKDDDGERSEDPQPVPGTDLLMSIPNGFYLGTKAYSGWVELSIDTFDSPPAPGDTTTTWPMTEFDVTVGDLYVGNFAGPCDTFPHPIHVDEGRWVARARSEQIITGNEPREHLVVQLRPASESS